MTETSGWPPVEQPEAQTDPEPGEDQSATPVPDEDADPQQVAEEAADAEPPELPDPDWLTEIRNNAPGWMVAFAEDVHRRLRNLGG